MSVNGVSKRLPAMLSPTLPPEFSEKGLPDELLSPTLPHAFQEESHSAKQARKSMIVNLKYESTDRDEPPKKKIKTNSLNNSVRDFSSSDEEKPKRLKVEKKPDKPDNHKPREDKPKEEKPPEAKRVPPEYREYKKKLQMWVDRARAKKHESDSAMTSKQHQLAVLVSMDSIICFMRAFDFEDRADACMKRVPHIRSWETLIPYLSRMSTYLESVDADIAGVCYFIRAVLYVHIAHVLHKTQSPQSPGGITSEAALQSAIKDFRKGLLYIPLEKTETKYNITWKKNVRNSGSMDPSRDKCVLPLHVNSSVQDAAAFAFHLTRVWADHENIEYNWVSGG